MSKGGPLRAQPEVWGRKRLLWRLSRRWCWGDGRGGGRGGQAMLLVEQGVLWVLPMLWLVLLLSEAGAVVETGCSLEMGPALRRRSREGVGRRGGRGGKKNNVGPKNKTRRRQGRQGMAHPGRDLSSPDKGPVPGAGLMLPGQHGSAPPPCPPGPDKMRDGDGLCGDLGDHGWLALTRCLGQKGCLGDSNMTAPLPGTCGTVGSGEEDGFPSNGTCVWAPPAFPQRYSRVCE